MTFQLKSLETEKNNLSKLNESKIETIAGLTETVSKLKIDLELSRSKPFMVENGRTIYAKQYFEMEKLVERVQAE